MEKEGLAIVCGVKKFHHYLYGRKFRINSDHKPLQYLFSENRTVPAMASARLQRWALFLSAYDYCISYTPGKNLANADSLSRLPLPLSTGEANADAFVPGELVLLLDNLQNSPVKASDIKTWTDRDPTLSRVRNMVQHGWSKTTDEALQPYRARERMNSLLLTVVCCGEAGLWSQQWGVPECWRNSMLVTQAYST